MEMKSRVIITAVAAALIIALLGRDTIEAVTTAWPLCVFTILAGLWLFFREEVHKQVLGIIMLLSPLYLIPLYNAIIDVIVGVF